MSVFPLSVLGLGAGLPTNEVTNEQLSEKLDTSDDWIRARTGILSRRIQPDLLGVTDLGIRAGRQALERSGLDPLQVDLVVMATLTPDHFMPATACRITAALGCDRAGAFDLNVACSGFLYAVLTSAAQLKAKNVKTVLCIGGDTVSRITNWEDRRTAVLFGDGAGAAVLTGEGDGCLLGWDYGVQGELAESLSIAAGPSRPSHCAADYKVRMDGRAVFRFATGVLVESSERALKRAQIDISEVDLIVPHQANQRILEGAAKRWGISLDRFVINVDRFGNTSAGSVPIALEEAYCKNRIKPGSLVLLSGFGGGLSWGSLVLRWKS